MNNITRLLRDNLLIVICIAVMLLSVVALFWPVMPQMAQFKDQLDDAENDLRTVRNYMSRNEEIPSADPDEPMRTIQLTVNPAAVDALNGIYDRMQASYEQIINRAVNFNRAGHEPMLVGLFPQASPWETPDPIAYQAGAEYQAAFQQLHDQLNAGTPPTDQEIEQRLQEAEDQFLAETINGDVGAANQAELEQRKARARLQLFMEHAETNLSVYAAQPGPASGAGGYSAGPFKATALATLTEKPTMALLWMSQMQLWIQQDIVAAIAMTNRTPDGKLRPVTEAPIKRVLAIAPEDGYRLPETTGEPTGRRESRTSARRTAPGLEAAAIDKPLPLNFRVSPTGRLSNPLYDVWMVDVRVIIESDAIPRFLDALGAVNFVTPIHREMIPLSPAIITEQFEQGYVYGSGADLVDLQVRLETLWMRQWTAGSFSREEAERRGEPYRPGLMPDIIRVQLGMPPRAEDFDADDTRTGAGASGRRDSRWGQEGGAPRGYEGDGSEYEGMNR